MRRLVLITALSLVPALTGAQSAPTPASAPGGAPELAFTRLQALVGNWEAKTAKGAVIRLSFRLISAGSALVEGYTTPSGRETLTIYHLDGARLMATHYCAQGNQPRLRLEGTGAEPRMVFTFFDATNLAAPADSHLRRLEFEWLDADHFNKTEIYTENSRDDATILKFTRIK